MPAVILSIGDELVLGQTIDTNSAYLSGQLASMGILTLYHQTIADDQNAIAQAIRQATQAAEWVLVTGGLGPTMDDLTRQALAQAMDVPLVLDMPSLQAIEAFFAKRNRTMAQSNRIQAMCPVGATMLPNACGTAPGIKAKLLRATVYVTPGVPGEMLTMWRRSIQPEIQAIAGASNPAGGQRTILTLKANTFGIGESTLGQMLGSLMDRNRNPTVGTTVSGGIVSVRIRSDFPQAEQARREMDRTLAQVQSVLGDFLFGIEEQTLQCSLVDLLARGDRQLVTAESCTGGMVAQAITGVPGSSAHYLGGWVTYANEMKQNELGVDAQLIACHGAVSEPVALAMANGALKQSRGDLAVSLTGIAGPGGAAPEKPVGLVWLAIADERSGDSFALRLDLGQNDRAITRDRAAKSALQALRFHLLGHRPSQMTWGQWSATGKQAT